MDAVNLAILAAAITAVTATVLMRAAKDSLWRVLRTFD